MSLRKPVQGLADTPGTTGRPAYASPGRSASFPDGPRMESRKPMTTKCDLPTPAGGIGLIAPGPGDARTHDSGPLPEWLQPQRGVPRCGRDRWVITRARRGSRMCSSAPAGPLLSQNPSAERGMWVAGVLLAAAVCGAVACRGAPRREAPCAAGPRLVYGPGTWATAAPGARRVGNDRLPSLIVRHRDGGVMVLVVSAGPNIAPFYFDQTEVTQSRYDAFRRITGYFGGAQLSGRKGYGRYNLFPLDESGVRRMTAAQYKVWMDEAYGTVDRERLPARQVSVRDAAHYAAWVGAELPTVAQFQAVLCVDAPGSPYPWGEAELPPRGFGNYADKCFIDAFPAAASWLRLSAGYEDGFAMAAPVGSFPPNSLGVFDVSGNVMEWCRLGPEPVVIEDGNRGSVRIGSALCGGGWLGRLEDLRCGYTADSAGAGFAIWSEVTGFRCARTVSSLTPGEIGLAPEAR